MILSLSHLATCEATVIYYIFITRYQVLSYLSKVDSISQNNVKLQNIMTRLVDIESERPNKIE